MRPLSLLASALLALLVAQGRAREDGEGEGNSSSSGIQSARCSAVLKDKYHPQGTDLLYKSIIASSNLTKKKLKKQ